MIRARVTIEVKSPDGKRKFKRTYKANSFVRNFLRLLGGFVMAKYPVDNWKLIDSVGADEVAGTANDDQANLQNSEVMILVGNGTTAPHIHDHTIEALLGYSLVLATSEFDSNPVYEIFWQVSIQNTDGVPWEVKETALYVRVKWDGTTEQIMIARDKIDPLVDVADGDFVNVTYGLRSSV